jgi:hypothetical protein
VSDEFERRQVSGRHAQAFFVGCVVLRQRTFSKSASGSQALTSGRRESLYQLSAAVLPNH